MKIVWSLSAVQLQVNVTERVFLSADSLSKTALTSMLGGHWTKSIFRWLTFFSE